MATSLPATLADVYAGVILAEGLAAGDVGAAVETSLSFGELAREIRRSADLRSHLADASLPLEVRQGMVDSLFSASPPAFLTVLRMLVERQEMGLLDIITERLTSLIEERLGVTVIDVTTVVELDDRLRATIQQKYSAQLGTPVVLREHLDRGIMGGIVMEMHNRRIDASLNVQLARAHAVLASDTIGGVN